MVTPQHEKSPALRADLANFNMRSARGLSGEKIMAESKPSTGYSLVDERIPAETTERRGSPRTHVDVDLTITSGGQELQGITRDLSRTGIFVSTYRVLPVGAFVRLKFAVPKGAVSALGIVSRVRSSSDGVTAGMAVTFGTLDELDRALLEDFCAEGHAPRSSDTRIRRPRSRR
jgi:hypothetical protein